MDGSPETETAARFSTHVELCKHQLQVDADGHEYLFVLGQVTASPFHVDLQKHWAEPQVIREACHGFMTDFQNLGVGHKRLVKNHEARIVENYMTPGDVTINGKLIPAETWMLGVRLYEKSLISGVQKGELNGFSLEGDGWEVPGDPPQV